MNLILFGFKGVGKTYYGRKLAAESGRPFIDTDELLGNPRELYKRLGETKFREEESKVIHGLVGTKGAIIAVGGGAILHNGEVLKSLGTLVYLDLEPRIDPETAFDYKKAYIERKPIYESIDAIRITDDVMPKLREILCLIPSGNFSE